MKDEQHGIVASLPPNEGANKSTLPKISSYKFETSSVLECKQIDNNILRNFFERSNFLKKTKNKKLFFLNSEK